jgi:hypothetical protein
MGGKVWLVAIILAVIFVGVIALALGNRLTRSDGVGIKGVGEWLRYTGSGIAIVLPVLLAVVIVVVIVVYALLPKPENYPPLI